MYDNIPLRVKEIQTNIARAQAMGGFSHPVTVCAVTKYHTTAEANAALAAGLCDIAENHVQELLRKTTDGLCDCRRHFIGHLQTNKVRQLLTVPGLTLVQSCDSEHLCVEINKRATSVQDVLIQVNIANEAQKFGVPLCDAIPLVRFCSSLENVRVKGYMAIMPIDTKDDYYRGMRDLFDETRALAIPNTDMDVLSMGMSGDYATAVRYGATMVRVGSYLFS